MHPGLPHPCHRATKPAAWPGIFEATDYTARLYYPAELAHCRDLLFVWERAKQKRRHGCVPQIGLRTLFERNCSSRDLAARSDLLFFSIFCQRWIFLEFGRAVMKQP